MNTPDHRPMTPQEIEHEWQRQQTAEQRERVQSGERDDAVIDQYRLIHRLLRKSDIPALPADFAQRVARQGQDFEQQAEFENVTLRIILAILVVAGVFYAAPVSLEAMRKIATAVSLPWPTLWAALLALLFAGMLDKASSRYRTRHH